MQCPYGWPLAGTALVAGVTALYGLIGYSPWSDWPPSPCAPNCFCEAFQPGAIWQPQSVYSNLFYVFVGLLILAAVQPAGLGSANLMSRQPAYARGYGLTVVAIGLTSEFYHLSLTQVGRWLDYMGMYLFGSWCLLYALARLRPLHGRVFAGAYLGINLALGGLWWWLPTLPLKRLLFGGLMLGLLVLELRWLWRRRFAGIRHGYWWLAWEMFLAAVVLNMGDEAGWLCVPQRGWQWHAVWHFLTAAAAGVLYFCYYRSEQPRPVA